MERKDIVVAIFGAAVGLGGILLVFVGFLYSRAETLDLDRQRQRFRIVAKIGIVPFLLSLSSAIISLHWMETQSAELYTLSVCTFYASAVLTALYGLGAFILYL